MAALTDAQRKLLEKPNYGVLAAVRPDGTPQLTTVWIDAEDGYVLVNTAKGRFKERYIKRDPRVSLYVRDEDDPYKWLAVTGHAELVEGGADAHIDRLAKKYTGRDSYPWRKEGERRVIIRISPERVIAYQV